MTRSFVIVIGIIIALALGWHFYVQWDLKRFEASLPKLAPTNDTANQGTAEAKNAIEDQEKFDSVTSGEHSHSDEWHTPSSELASDETQEHPVPEEHSQLGVPNIEEPEPIEDLVAVQLQTKKLELLQLQDEVNDMGNRFYNALEAQSISVDEANAIFEELKEKLKHLREQRHQWLREYAKHYGTEYQGPEHWANSQMIDEAALQEQTHQEAQEQGVSRGYIILPRRIKR